MACKQYPADNSQFFPLPTTLNLALSSAEAGCYGASSYQTLATEMSEQPSTALGQQSPPNLQNFLQKQYIPV